MRVAGGIVPAAVPRDPRRGSRDAACFAMAYLAAGHATRCGRRSCATARSIRATAAAVGDVLGRIHAATADRPDIAARFPTDAHLPRDPARALSRRHRARASRPRARASTRWSRRRATTKRVLVHGDVSPKNILIGPARPGVPRRRMRLVRRPGVRPRVLLNHLLLKGAWRPQWRARYARLRSTRWRDAYLAHVAWEPRGGARGAHGGAAAGPACWRASTASRRSST